MARKQRVFTRYMYGGGASTALTGGAEAFTFDAVDLWLVQEDIEVVGAYVSAKICSDYIDLNAGGGEYRGELSQVGVASQDGCILRSRGNYGSHGAQHLGTMHGAVAVVAIMPSGLAIPVKEEGHLYLNAHFTANVGSVIGKFLSIGVEAIVYYTKPSVP